MVLLDEGSRERQSEARSTVAPGDEGKEDPLAQRLRNSRPVVLDMQFRCQTIPLLAERHLADDSGAQHDAPVARLDPRRKRLGGIADDVEERLDQLLAV